MVKLVEGKIVGFNYECLKGKAGKSAKVHAEAIRALLHRTARNMIDVGLHLIEVHKQIPHGLWAAWLQCELEWSVTLAWKFTTAAKIFHHSLVTFRKNPQPG